MTYAAAVVEVVRALVAKQRRPGRAMGTVASRDASGARTMVVIDGDAVAVPVKCFASVDAYPGDRVGLLHFGDWVIVGSFTRHGSSYESVHVVLGSDSTSSASYVDMDGGHPFTWRKQYDDTDAVLRMLTGGFTNVANSFVGTAINVSGGTGDVPIAVMVYSTTIHLYHGGEVTVHGLPAGLYTLTARWKLAGGTGPVQCNLNDTLSMSVTEVGASQAAGPHTN